jgi:hypothetical protein
MNAQAEDRIVLCLREVHLLKDAFGREGTAFRNEPLDHRERLRPKHRFRVYAR